MKQKSNNSTSMDYAYFGVRVIETGVVAYLLWLLWRRVNDGHWPKGWIPFGDGSDPGGARDGKADTSDGTGGKGTGNDGNDKKPTDWSYDFVFDKATGKFIRSGKVDADGNPIQGANFTRYSFINNYLEYAKNQWKITKIFPEVMFSQAIIESSDKNGNFGMNSTAQKANNFFGILADGSWQGDVFVEPTSKNRFRAYASVEDSLNDYYDFLQGNSTYRDNGVFDASTPSEQAQCVANAGYAGANNAVSYGVILTSLIGDVMKYEAIIDPSGGYDNSDVAKKAKDAMDKANSDYNKSGGVNWWIVGVGALLVVGGGYEAKKAYSKKGKFSMAK